MTYNVGYKLQKRSRRGVCVHYCMYSTSTQKKGVFRRGDGHSQTLFIVLVYQAVQKSQQLPHLDKCLMTTSTHVLSYFLCIFTSWYNKNVYRPSSAKVKVFF